MARIVAIIFFGLAALSVVAYVAIQSQMIGAGALGDVLAVLPGALSTGLALFGFGLVYWLIGKAAPNPVSMVFGILHIILALFHQVFSAAAQWMQIQVITGENLFNVSDMGLMFGAAGITFGLGMMCHVAAIISAIATSSEHREDEMIA